MSFSGGEIDTYDAIENGRDTFTAQEDIMVESITLLAKIGSWVTTLALAGREYAAMDIDVSGAGAFGQAGTMGMITVESAITLQGGITPNAVPVGTSRVVDYVFASPYLIKEEGTVSLHSYISNETGATVTFNGKAIVRYTKA